MIVSANVTKDLITFRSSPSTPDTISVSAQAGQRALTSTPDALIKTALCGPRFALQSGMCFIFPLLQKEMPPRLVRSTLMQQ